MGAAPATLFLCSATTRPRSWAGVQSMPDAGAVEKNRPASGQLPTELSQAQALPENCGEVHR